MKVWIISVGTQCEGSLVRGVFAKKGDALDFVKGIECPFGKWKRAVNKADHMEWTAKCDYISMKLYEVR